MIACRIDDAENARCAGQPAHQGCAGHEAIGIKRPSRKRSWPPGRTGKLAPAIALLVGVFGAHSAAANDISDTSSPPIPLIKTQCSAPEYPAESMRAGETGSVVLSMIVATNGVPHSVEVAQSSGSQRLDAAAMKALRTCQFTPKRVDGVPIEARGLFRYTFGQPPPLPNALESLVQPIRLQRYITALSARCQAHFPELATALDAAHATWHLHNDTLARKLDDYTNSWNIQEAGPTQSAVAQNLAVQSASFAITSFEEQTEPEQRAYCQRYIERLSNGSLDLIGIVIRFPELEAAVVPPTQEATAP